MKIGIDYSLSSPGVCVNTSEGEFRYEDCTFYFLTNTKKYNDTFKVITAPVNMRSEAVKFIGSPHQLYTNEPERYSNIADWVIDIIKTQYPPHHVSKKHPIIQIENYSYGSTGRVFHIAENLGLLKYKLKMECGWDYTLLPPSVIKKFATGKGNANKDLMLEAFEEETHTNLGKVFDTTSKSPISDIADAYFICKYTEE
jgi:Holliday junction resolvasome RuvABC endonuclease subunit